MRIFKILLITAITFISLSNTCLAVNAKDKDTDLELNPDIITEYGDYNIDIIESIENKYNIELDIFTDDENKFTTRDEELQIYDDLKNALFNNYDGKKDEYKLDEVVQKLNLFASVNYYYKDDEPIKEKTKNNLYPIFAILFVVLAVSIGVYGAFLLNDIKRKKKK